MKNTIIAVLVTLLLTNTRGRKRTRKVIYRKSLRGRVRRLEQQVKDLEASISDDKTK